MISKCGTDVQSRYQVRCAQIARMKQKMLPMPKCKLDHGVHSHLAFPVLLITKKHLGVTQPNNQTSRFFAAYVGIRRNRSAVGFLHNMDYSSFVSVRFGSDPALRDNLSIFSAGKLVSSTRRAGLGQNQTVTNIGRSEYMKIAALLMALAGLFFLWIAFRTYFLKRGPNLMNMTISAHVHGSRYRPLLPTT